MKERHLFPKERNRVVVACSGGPDSLCLLYLLWSCRDPLRLDLSVMTCDHGLRPESKAEALDVRQRAWALGLPCAFRMLEVPGHQRPGESVEMTARRLRREAYANVAAELQADQVALGHHLDDQAETVLLRLIRGTGPRGAGGMQWVSALNESVDLIRPLLDTRREEIEKTLRSWGMLAFRDPSNQSREHIRNRLRLDVMPQLEAVNPGVVRHLADFSEDQRRLDAWVSAEAEGKSGECVQGKVLRLEPWRFFPEVLRERILFGWFRQRGGRPEEVTRAAWRQLFEDLEQSVSHSRRWILGGHTLIAEQDVLTVGRPDLSVEPRPLPDPPGQMMCDAIGRILRVDPVSRVDLSAAGRQDLEGELTGYIRCPDQDLTLRTPRVGDRYRPLGMTGTVKVSDLMTNAKIPARLRPVWPVVSQGEEIVWIPGFRVAEAWRVTRPPCWRLRLTPGEMHTFCG